MKNQLTPDQIAASTLQAAASTANLAIDAIIQKEAEHARKTLPERIAIGLACLKAHEVFAVQDPGKRNPKGINQHTKGGQLTREVVTVSKPKSNKAQPTSFQDWLERDLPRLKEVTAYKYMKAAVGLGMIEPSTEPEAIVASLEAWEAAYKQPPTLAALIACNTLRLDPGKTPVLQQSEFDFFKENASNCRQQVEYILTLKERLPEPFRKALSAQFYTALYELTGTHWQPCDDAPGLALIDPGTIEL